MQRKKNREKTGNTHHGFSQDFKQDNSIDI